MITAPLVPLVHQRAMVRKAARKLTGGDVAGRLTSGIYSYISQRHLDPYLGQFVDQDCGSR